ncbi:uncharacterized protein LOC141729657 isoform X3 [Zonotrichia albicollis]|uniref:uncharacterized protein LOC141729657 isoform X3 n=1 Tax=Zonotrichia albicollis TaxID=44394 RepID=UPI003D810FA9
MRWDRSRGSGCPRSPPCPDGRHAAAAAAAMAHPGCSRKDGGGCSVPGTVPARAAPGSGPLLGREVSVPGSGLARHELERSASEPKALQAPSAGTKRRMQPAPGPRLLGAPLCARSRSVCPGREPQRPCRRSVCPGSEAPGQGIMRGTMALRDGCVLSSWSNRRKARHHPRRLRSSLLGESAQMAATVLSGSSRGGNGAGQHSEPGEAAAELEGGSCPGCHQRGWKAAPEAELPKDLPALLMSREQGSCLSIPSDSGCEVEESEVCSIHGVGKKFPKEPEARVPDLLAVLEATCLKQKVTTCERAVSADEENGFCTSDGSVREPLAPQGTAATGNERKMNLRRFLGERFRCHPVGTAVLILLLLVLVLALGAAVAVQSAPQVPLTPATSQSLMGCSRGWFGVNGVCYRLSAEYSTWEQGQERCSELGASLAIAKDEEAMDLLFRLHGNIDYWLGLRRRGERLHWGDGSSYSSRVPVDGNSECLYLADRRFRSRNCSSERLYVCSKAQAPL